MTDKQPMDTMTVLELRKLAKEQGVPLTGATTKAAIIERLHQASSSQEDNLLTRAEAATQPQSASPPVRRATIIADDGDDQSRPAPRAPRQPATAAPGKTSTGKVKPAFTLQGSRAWHNPQPFAQSQPPPQRYAPQITQGISTLPRGPQALDTSIYPAPKPKPAAPRAVSRFGPDAASAEPVQEYQMGVRESQPYSRPAITPERNAYQSNAFRSLLPQQTQAALPEIAEEADLPIPEPGFALPEVARDNSLTAQVTDLLAAGDLGDGAGVLEIQQDGYGFLRAGNLLPGRNDIYVSGTQIRRFRLRNGDYIVGKTRAQRETDRYAAMLYITSVNGEEIDTSAKLGTGPVDGPQRRDFDELTPTYPNRIIKLSSRDENDLVLRLIDLFIPIGFGQRAMIVAAPKAGKTTILKKIALSLKRNHPDVHSMMLLVDERPEEVTDLKESVGGDIFYSTFDEPPESHAKVSELTLERAMRFVEQGRDVVILLDSLTRMSRAYNTLMPGSARVMTGGLAAGAMNKPKRFFGAARNLKEGGSLTIIATALVDTGSRMDGVIFEEFKGTGNMELTLDRTLSERRLFPAVSLLKSGTRHEELLLTEKEREVAAKVRDRFSMSSEQEAISLILSMLEKSRDNDEFVTRYDDWMKLMRG